MPDCFKTEDRNRVYYEINEASPFFKPLEGLCRLPESKRTGTGKFKE